MNRSIIILMILSIQCIAAPVAMAGTITLEWGAVSGAEGYRAYRMPVGEQPVTTPPRTPELTVPASAAANGKVTGSFAIPNGEHAFFVTSYNGWGESPPSNIVQTPPLPVAPGNLRVTVIVDVQTP